MLEDREEDMTIQRKNKKFLLVYILLTKALSQVFLINSIGFQRLSFKRRILSYIKSTHSEDMFLQ